MKIGVVTFWWGNDNYGQIAQCFALQQVLKSLGHEPFIVRCRPQASWKSKIARLLRVVKSPKSYFRQKKWERIVRPRNRKFREFLEEHCEFSVQNFCSFSELKENCPEADCFIAGSDQVWNCNPDNNGRIWFLDFVPEGRRKIAYAASFGKIRTTSIFKKFCREKLLSFSFIGVREKEGENFLGSLGISSTCVLDPTLLLTREDYEKYAGLRDSAPEKPFAFCYWLGRHDPKDVLPCGEVAEILSKNAWDLKSVVAGVPFPVFGLGTPDSLMLPQWISAIRDAEVVFTNSFHGMVFCLIFNRPMVVFPALSGIGNGRLHSLLSLCGLEDRIYVPKTNTVESILAREINWKRVNDNLEIERFRSSTFLASALKS